MGSVACSLLKMHLGDLESQEGLEVVFEHFFLLCVGTIVILQHFICVKKNEAMLISKFLSNILVNLVIPNEEVRFARLGLVQHVVINASDACNDENVIVALLHLKSCVIVVGLACHVDDQINFGGNLDAVHREIHRLPGR